MLRTQTRDDRDGAAPARTATLPGGLRLPYVESGDPRGMTVVFLHGYTDSHRSFDLLLPLLPASFRLIALTQRGHGDADRPAWGYHPRDFAHDLGAFMDALGVESAVLVGHSMGSQVAQRVAIEQPARVRGLVLIGGFPSLGTIAAMREFWTSSVSSLMDPVGDRFAREFQISTLANPVPPDFLETVVAESLKVPARVWRDAFAGQMGEDTTAELGRIRARTLLLWGDRDAFFARSVQDSLVRGLPQARLRTYAGVGHAVHWEVPARVAADIATFLERIGR